MKDPREFKLLDVILSYPYVIDPDTQDGRDRWRARFLIDPDSKTYERNIEAAEEAILAAAKEKWGDRYERMMPPQDRLCLRETREDDERFPNWPFVQAATTHAPELVLPEQSPDGSWLTLDRGRPADLDRARELFYPGARVNVLLTAWVQDNQHGKRINCFLDAIQFREHGERLGGAGKVDVDGAFDVDDVPEVSFTDESYADDDADAPDADRGGESRSRGRLFGRRR